MQTGIKLSLLKALIVCIVQCTHWPFHGLNLDTMQYWSHIRLISIFFWYQIAKSDECTAHLVNIRDWKLWWLPMGRPRVPTPSSSLNSLATAPSNDTPPKYSNLRISHWLCWKTLSWQWVWILSPNHPFAGICSSFSAVNFVRLLQLVPSGTFGCFGNVTDRVRHTLYKCYGPCTPYTV